MRRSAETADLVEGVGVSWEWSVAAPGAAHYLLSSRAVGDLRSVTEPRHLLCVASIVDPPIPPVESSYRTLDV